MKSKVKLFVIKAKAEFEVVIEAENKDEANEWANQVLPDIIKIDDEYADRLVSADKTLDIKKAKSLKV